MPKFVDTDELFSCIESIKNGLLFAAKYESIDVVTGKPHIVCLSNYLPVDPSAISLDLWKIFRIGGEYKALIPMDKEQANHFISDYFKFEKEQQKYFEQFVQSAPGK